jgi:hypothetical protein
MPGFALTALDAWPAVSHSANGGLVELVVLTTIHRPEQPARAEVHTARAAKVLATLLDKPSSASAQGRHGRLEVADVDREKRCLMELSRPDLDDAARMNFLHVPNVV